MELVIDTVDLSPRATLSAADAAERMPIVMLRAALSFVEVPIPIESGAPIALASTPIKIELSEFTSIIEKFPPTIIERAPAAVVCVPIAMASEAVALARFPRASWSPPRGDEVCAKALPPIAILLPLLFGGAGARAPAPIAIADAVLTGSLAFDVAAKAPHPIAIAWVATACAAAQPGLEIAVAVVTAAPEPTLWAWLTLITKHPRNAAEAIAVLRKDIRWALSRFFPNLKHAIEFFSFALRLVLLFIRRSFVASLGRQFAVSQIKQTR